MSLRRDQFALLVALLSLSAIVGNLVEAEVKELLFNHKLQPVTDRELPREQAIVDLATGAKYMHESLFVQETIVRCSSYFHLFKLIKQQLVSHPSSYTSRRSKRIRQDVVESLAIMVAMEKEFYESLFKADLQTLAPEYFLEATVRLENFRPSPGEERHVKGAWLDLLTCMSNYMEKHGKLNDPAIKEFLSKEERAEALEEARKSAELSSSVQTTTGLVAYLTKEISGDAMNGRSVGGRFVSNKTLAKHSELIASLDDPKTAEARTNYGNRHNSKQARVAQDDQISSSSTKGRDFLDDKMNGIKEPMFDYEEEEEDSSNAQTTTKTSTKSSQFNEDQMAALEFIKTRLNNSPLAVTDARGANKQTDPVGIDMQLAIDFLVHFEDLESAKLDPTSELGKQAISFLQDPQSKQLLARVEAAVEKYVKLVSILAELEMQKDSWNSVKDDLEPQLARISELLETVDSAFDYEDVRRMLAVWQKSAKEFDVIHRFILDSD